MRVLVLIALVLLAAGCISGEEPTASGVESSSTLAAADAATTSVPPVAGVNSSSTTTTTVEIDYEELLEETTTTMVPSNVSGCLRLENASEKDLCLYEIAAKEKRKETCDLIGERNVKLKCRARMEDLPEYCDQVDVLSEKDWCYRMMAFRWSRIDYCKIIFEQGVRDKCIFDFLKDKKADPLGCYEIGDMPLRDDCLYYHVGLGRINPQLCMLIYNGTLELECNRTYLSG